MPKNKGRGGKNYRRGKNENLTKRTLEVKEEGQDYAHVIKILGNGRLLVLCFGDGKQRMGHIRGKMKRRVWIYTGDIVLIALREFQDEKCDVVLKYFPEEVKQLKNLKDIPENIQINEEEEHHQFNVEFEERKSSEEEESSEEDDEEEDEDEEEEEEEEEEVKPPPKKAQQQQQPKQQPKPAQQQPQKNKGKGDDKGFSKNDIDDL